MKRDWNSLYDNQGVVQVAPSPKVVEATGFLLGADSGTVLDLGCGTGRHTPYLLREGFQVLGCDASGSALQIARAAIPQAEFQQCDIGSLPYRDGSIEAILSHAVIQHGVMATIRKVIAEMHRVLRPGGRLFVTVVSTEHPEYLTGHEIEPRTKIGIDAVDGDMPHHYFTEEDIKECFGSFDISGLEHYRAPSEKQPARMAATWAIYAVRT